MGKERENFYLFISSDLLRASSSTRVTEMAYACDPIPDNREYQPSWDP